MGGADDNEPLRWFIDGACEALRLAALHVERITGDDSGRARPLVGLPLVGTGHGGGRQQTGEIVKCLLPALRETARASGVGAVTKPFSPCLTCSDGPPLS